MELTALLQDASHRLPPGWSILIAIRQGAWEIELYDPDGDLVDDFEADGDAGGMLRTMIEYAREEHGTS